jgi:SAM-dependent methyltransferase
VEPGPAARPAVAEAAPQVLTGSPSDWVERHAGRIPSGGRALDVACGGGRHTRYLLQLGFHVTAVDRDTSKIADLDANERVEILTADLENDSWPLAGRQFDGIVVTDYLHRPHYPHLIESLAPGGVLIFDTFAVGNENFGRPRNPDYLLRPGELLESFSAELSIVAFEHGEVTEPRPAMRQRICAVKLSVGDRGPVGD